jgi:dTDP-6-deoxy-L-talose 4-dehydrogenase (NAD+)
METVTTSRLSSGKIRPRLIPLMSRILITGSTGFIGSAVLRQALAAGHEVGVLLRPGHAAPRTDSPASTSPASPAVTALTGSMAQPPWEDLRRFSPDTLIHCAWIATPGVYLESPENELHAQWSEALALGLVEQGLRQLVVLGTCIEYRMGSARLHETETPLEPTTPYARAKDQLRRRLVEPLADHPGVRMAWGRVFYPYGEGEHPARLCSSLISSLRRGDEVVLKTPESTKDYIHISDLAGAILRVAEAQMDGPVNLGTGSGVTVREIAERLATLLERTDRVRVASPAAPDPLGFIVANAGRLRKLGWEPKVTLESGLRRLIDTTHS